MAAAYKLKRVSPGLPDSMMDVFDYHISKDGLVATLWLPRVYKQEDGTLDMVVQPFPYGPINKTWYRASNCQNPTDMEHGCWHWENPDALTFSTGCGAGAGSIGFEHSMHCMVTNGWVTFDQITPKYIQCIENLIKTKDKRIDGI